MTAAGFNRRRFAARSSARLRRNGKGIRIKRAGRAGLGNAACAPENKECFKRLDLASRDGLKRENSQRQSDAFYENFNQVPEGLSTRALIAVCGISASGRRRQRGSCGGERRIQTHVRL